LLDSVGLPAGLLSTSRPDLDVFEGFDLLRDAVLENFYFLSGEVLDAFAIESRVHIHADVVRARAERRLVLCLEDDCGKHEDRGNVESRHKYPDGRLAKESLL